MIYGRLCNWSQDCQNYLHNYSYLRQEPQNLISITYNAQVIYQALSYGSCSLSAEKYAPYGIREATERIGTTKNYKISDEHLKTHIPSKIQYGLTQIYTDLLNFAAKHLKLRGRLVSWIPVYNEDYKESNLPSHPCLTMISNSEQTLSCHTSRRLLTWEKFREARHESDCTNVPEMFPYGFRQYYFGQGETRKKRRARLAKEVTSNGCDNSPKEN